MESESSEIKQPIAYVSDTLVPAPSDPEQEYGAIHEGQNVGEAVASLDKEIVSLSDKADKDLKTHNTSEDAHADIRAAVAMAQSTAESAGDDANRIAGTITTHISNTDNPHSVTAAQVGADPVGTAEAKVIEHNTDETAHGDIRAAVANAQQQADSALQNSIVAHNLAVEVEGNLNSHKDDKNNPHAVTASQVGADPAGTAASAVNAHNISEDAHADIRSKKLDKESETTSLSLRQDDVGFIVADTAGVYHATFNPTGLVHNVPDSVNHTLSFPSKDGVLALTSDISDHTENTDNPHSVTELQVLTATTETADRSFVRAEYNYEGKPAHIDCKVTDKILFEGRGGTATRFSSLYMIGKLQALNITGQGNAGGHLILEGAGTDPYGLTLRTVGSGGDSMPSIEINPATSTTIKGDLNIASRAAVTTGSYQKTASAGDLTADGTITAKTGMKITQKYDETTTIDVMSVDSTAVTVQSPKIVLKNELGTPRIWTDSDAIYIETEPPVTIKSDMDDVNITSNSGSVYIDAGGTIIDAGYNAIRLSADNSIGIYAGTVDSVGNSLTMDFPEITITGNIDLPSYDNKVTIASQIDYGGEVETLGDAELLPIKKFGRTRYLATVDVLYSQGSSGIVFAPGYLYSNDLLKLPNGTVFSDYYLLNPGDTSVNPFSFSIDTSDTPSDVVFLKDTSSSVINLNIPSWGIAMVRVYISNAGTGIPVGESMKTAYIVRIEHLGTFSV